MLLRRHPRDRALRGRSSSPSLTGPPPAARRSRQRPPPRRPPRGRSGASSHPRQRHRRRGSRSTQLPVPRGLPVTSTSSVAPQARRRPPRIAQPVVVAGDPDDVALAQGHPARGTDTAPGIGRSRQVDAHVGTEEHRDETPRPRDRRGLSGSDDLQARHAARVPIDLAEEPLDAALAWRRGALHDAIAGDTVRAAASAGDPVLGDAHLDRRTASRSTTRRELGRRQADHCVPTSTLLGEDERVERVRGIRVRSRSSRACSSAGLRRSSGRTRRWSHVRLAEREGLGARRRSPRPSRLEQRPLLAPRPTRFRARCRARRGRRRGPPRPWRSASW